MKPGPKRTSKEVLEQRGSWLAKTRTSGPKPSPHPPTCPEWLNADEREVWEELTTKMADMGLLTETDSEIYIEYAVTYCKWKSAAQNPIAKHTEVLGYSRSLLKLRNELGLTPASRAALGVPSPTEDASKAEDNTEEKAKGEFLRLVTAEE